MNILGFRALSRDRVLLLLIAALAAPACQSRTTAGSGRSERERDSIIGQSSIPGAGGVKKALDVADSSKARVGKEDSIANAE